MPDNDSLLAWAQEVFNDDTQIDPIVGMQAAQVIALCLQNQLLDQIVNILALK